MTAEWITTGVAIRMMGFALSPHTFRDKYQEMVPWTKTPGGHFRWLKSEVQAMVDQMSQAS